MPKFELKLVNGNLAIDMNSEVEYTPQGMVVRGYDGAPNKYDVCDLGPAFVIGIVELSDEQLAKINAEYENGGECGWCGEVRNLLRNPHMFDHGRNGEKMCHFCWNHDRAMYISSYGEDIGPFDENDQSKPCSQCNNFTLPKEQLAMVGSEMEIICCECAEKQSGKSA